MMDTSVWSSTADQPAHIPRSALAQRDPDRRHRPSTWPLQSPPRPPAPQPPARSRAADAHAVSTFAGRQVASHLMSDCAVNAVCACAAPSRGPTHRQGLAALWPLCATDQRPCYSRLAACSAWLQRSVPPCRRGPRPAPVCALIVTGPCPCCHQSGPDIYPISPWERTHAVCQHGDGDGRPMHCAMTA